MQTINVGKYPLTCAILPYSMGIVLGYYTLSFTFALFLSIFTFFLYILLHKRPQGIIFLLILIMCCGGLRYKQVSSVNHREHIRYLSTDSITQTAATIISARYSKNQRHSYVLALDSVRYTYFWRIAVGKILLRTSKIRHTYDYGTHIIINGRPQLAQGQRNPGQFDYRKYLAQQDVSHILYLRSADSVKQIAKNKGNLWQSRIIQPVKSYCLNVFNGHLSEDGASLMSALILGEKQNIDRNIIERFQQVGVVHVLAISGLHVGYIIIFISTILSFLRLSPKLRLIFLAAVLGIYIVLVDFKPPVMRASIMALLYLSAQIMQRKTDPAQVLSAAAIIILLSEPRELFNPGFQFSFTAVIAIIYGYRKLNQFVPANVKLLNYKLIRNGIVSPLLVSLSAVIGTVPLTLHYYGVVPVIAVIANLFVIPLIGIIVLLGFFLLLFHTLSFTLSDGLGIMIAIIQDVLLWITHTFSRIPCASLDFPIPDLGFIILLSLGLMIITFLHTTYWRKILPVYVLSSAIYLLIKVMPGAPLLQATFIDVGQGDAAYLEFPNGSTMLIDAGNANNYWDHGKKTITPLLKYIGNHKINYLVGSHPHDDHIGGFLSIITKIPVDTVVVSAYNYPSRNYRLFLQLCQDQAIPIRKVQKGEQLYPDSTCRVYILHPDSQHANYSSGSGAECNNSSLVMKVQYGKNGILFTGDLEMEAEPTLFPYASFMECEILKVAHHGSKTSTSQPLLDYIQPLVAIISVAKKNKFKHPSPGTVNRLADNNIQPYFTSRDGALRFEIGSHKIRKIAWK